MARVISAYEVELRPVWFGGYMARIAGRSYRFVERGRKWQARAPTFPGLGRVAAEAPTLRGCVKAILDETVNDRRAKGE